MDSREALKSMLNNLINDKQEEASLDLHNYLTTKMKVVAGTGTAPTIEDPEIEVDPDANIEAE